MGAVIHPCNFPIAISLLSIARGDVAGVAFAVWWYVGLLEDPVECFPNLMQFTNTFKISYSKSS